MRTFDSSLKHQMLLMFRYYVADISASELEGTSVSVTATEVPALRDLRSARGGVSGAGGALVLVVVVAVTGDVPPLPLPRWHSDTWPMWRTCSAKADSCASASRQAL